MIDDFSIFTALVALLCLTIALVRLVRYYSCVERDFLLDRTPVSSRRAVTVLGLLFLMYVGVLEHIMVIFLIATYPYSAQVGW